MALDVLMTLCLDVLMALVALGNAFILSKGQRLKKKGGFQQFERRLHFNANSVQSFCYWWTLAQLACHCAPSFHARFPFRWTIHWSTSFRLCFFSVFVQEKPEKRPCCNQFTKAKNCSKLRFVRFAPVRQVTTRKNKTKQGIGLLKLISTNMVETQTGENVGRSKIRTKYLQGKRERARRSMVWWTAKGKIYSWPRFQGI